MATTATILNSNGRNLQPQKEPDEFSEIGSLGLQAWSGYIQAAYHTQVRWPSCEPLYSRIWRSDPETVIVRQLFSALAGKLALSWEVPEADDETEPTDDDKKAADFANSVMSDMEGGAGKWMESAITRIPFYGFGVWERVAGLRSPTWTAPDGDTWKSQYSDGLVGIRKLAWRDYSSFSRWEMDDRTGRVNGMWQVDAPNPQVLLPSDRLLHVTFGDHDNPEGLATLEALWRLERILYALEIVQGIGYQHTAGHLSVTVEEADYDEFQVRQAARAIMTPQEGNYVAWPKGVTGAIIDSSFGAAESLERAIQNRRILKLALFGMQFVAISTMSGSGSYAALDDSSSMAMLVFNSIAAGITKQASESLGEWLFSQPVNAAAFPGMTRRPVLTVSQVDKAMDLTQLAQFSQAIAAVMPLGDDDYIAIRQASGFLPGELPEEDPEPVEAEPEQVEPVAEPAADTGGASADAPANIESVAGLNGAQITAVLQVLEGVASGATAALVAVELLTAVGIQPERAARMVAATLQVEGPEPEPDADAEPPEFAELADGDKFKPAGDAIDVSGEAVITEGDIEKAIASFEKWASKNAPDVAAILRAEVADS